MLLYFFASLDCHSNGNKKIGDYWQPLPSFIKSSLDLIVRRENRSLAIVGI